jgi:hypothetical protein
MNGRIPLFIKPLFAYKAFTAMRADSSTASAILEKQPKDMKLLWSQPIDIISEFRCFVLNRKLIGCKNYTGSFGVLPNFDIVLDAIHDYKKQPIAYALDFAVTPDDKTSLLEINDGYGLGTYGFNNILYCKMILARWDEIVA